jgi:uncharacterized repeat protein (TIGR03803 family)
MTRSFSAFVGPVFALAISLCNAQAAIHFKILHDFAGTPDGALPESFIVDRAGNVIGTAASGGGSTWDGMIFKLSPDGTYTVLHGFSGSDGRVPVSFYYSQHSGKVVGSTQAARMPVTIMAAALSTR